MRAALILAIAACNPLPDHKLPSVSLAPQLQRVQSSACGDDISAQGGTPDLRYVYAFDVFGRLAHATGTYTAGGPSDSIDYTYDNLDHLTHMVETRAQASFEIVAEYDTLGDLLDYTSSQTAPSVGDVRRCVYSELTADGQPAREVISVQGAPDVGYHLEYDASNRIVRATTDAGSVTSYTYDDAEARTITIDTDGGAAHGEVGFDDRDDELYETWTGSDPSEIDNDTRYDYDGDRLLTVTYRQARSDAPHLLQVVEVDRLRYDCSPARHR